MRRALIVLGILMLSLLTAAPVLADDETQVGLAFKAGRFTLALGTDNEEQNGRDEASLVVSEGAGESRSARYNLYVAEAAAASRSGVDVSFGARGRFLGRFSPTRTESEGEGCEREVRKTGWFEGEFSFHGEGGYLDVERTRVKGAIVVTPGGDCDRARTAARKPSGEKPESAVFDARVPGERGLAVITLNATTRTGEWRRVPWFVGFEAERSEGVEIIRVCQAYGRKPSSFRFDHERGTATARPPAPFKGSAHFVRRAGGDNLWRGNLSMLPLGNERVPLAGPDFKASLKDEEVGLG